jgi:hypothetical protein
MDVLTVIAVLVLGVIALLLWALILDWRAEEADHMAEALSLTDELTTENYRGVTYGPWDDVAWSTDPPDSEISAEPTWQAHVRSDTPGEKVDWSMTETKP